MSSVTGSVPASIGEARDRTRWFALPVILVGTFMTILDFFIVNVAIPSAQAELNAGDAQVQFVVAGYGVAYASGLITGGRLGDLYGRRTVFAIRPHGVHRGLGPVRPGGEPGDAGDLPGSAGHGGRAHVPAGPVHHQRHVHR
ncbi:MFS transporter [Microbispora rosea]|uniref:MFS transporter n=1 Tax=Microbispora rosea TaxID=58117 RepID=UPI003D92931E